MTTGQTPSQTVGPFFALGLTPEQCGYPFTSIAGNDLAGPGTAGTPVALTGQVLDGESAPVSDAMIEIWQADAAGTYAGEGSNTGFTGFGRTGIDAGDKCCFAFHTIKPGAVADGHAPHINVIVFMRGALNHLFTRIYFPEDGAAHKDDPVLAAVPAARRATLIARPDGGNAYRFDIHLQGAHETVFFDL